MTTDEMHTCKPRNMCLLTNPQNMRVITGFKKEGEEEENQEEEMLLLLHRKKQALWKQVDCNKNKGERKRKGRKAKRSKVSCDYCGISAA